MERIKFMLDGCDIQFIAEAPKDITLEQLLKQCDKIEPHWCACGIRNLIDFEKEEDIDLLIYHDGIRKTEESVSCRIDGE